MGWFDKAVKKGVDSAIEKASAPGGVIETTVHDVLREMALRDERYPGPRSQSQFIWDMAFHMMRTDRTMRPPEARDRSIRALRAFLRDEGIKWGDPAYVWDQAAAKTLARELDTDHWERVA